MTGQKPVVSPPPRSEYAPSNDLDVLWEDALKRYTKETGKSLSELAIAKSFPAKPIDTDDVIKHFEKQLCVPNQSQV